MIRYHAPGTTVYVSGVQQHSLTERLTVSRGTPPGEAAVLALARTPAHRGTPIAVVTWDQAKVAAMGTTGAGTVVQTVIDYPRLLAAAPIVAVSDELNQHVADLTRLAPASDATAALTLYRDKLVAALTHARQLDLFVSADVASVILGKSVGMIQHLCRSGALKAKKIGGTWEIDRLDLERLRADHASPPRAD